MSKPGFFAIGIVNGKKEVNIGTLWRTAAAYDAAFVFTVGERYKRQSSDTVKVERHIPLLHFSDMEDFKKHLPAHCFLVGVELTEGADTLGDYYHPDQAAYLLGSEGSGLSEEELLMCDDVVTIPYPAPWSLNVSVAGSMVIYDRDLQKGRNVR